MKALSPYGYDAVAKRATDTSAAIRMIAFSDDKHASMHDIRLHKNGSTAFPISVAMLRIIKAPECLASHASLEVQSARIRGKMYPTPCVFPIRAKHCVNLSNT